jgi:hypothetical protein
MTAILAIFAAIPAWVWKWGAIAIAVVSIYGYGDLRGRRIEHDKAVAEAQAAQKAADAQDLQAEKDGRAQDLEITNNLVNQKKVDDDAISKLKSDLAAKPPAACLYDQRSADPPEPSARRVRPRPVPNNARASNTNAPAASGVPAARTGAAR